MATLLSHKGRLIGPAIASALALAMVASNAAPAGAQSARITNPQSRIELSAGRGRLITLPANVSDVFVADERIADVQVRSTRQVYVFAKALGTTSFYATSSSGTVVYSAEVAVGSDIGSIDQMLAIAMPDAKISVNQSRNFVLLTGTIRNPEDAAEAESLVQAFVGDEMKVVSRLKTATPLQVNLKVRIAEVSKSLAKAINGNILTRDTTDGFQFGIARGREGFGTINDFDTTQFPLLDASNIFGLPAGSISLPFNPVTGQFVTGGTQFAINNLAGSTTVAALGKLFGVDVASAFDASEQAGLITTLATPNLSAKSGETATFLAGGEFPIPISSGFNQVTVEYRTYGVSLSYTPTVLANGRISIRVAPEVSELSSQGAVRLNGFEIPAVSIRKAETTIELGSGQSFMIAGLLQNDYQTSIDKTPGLGDVPILGTLFKSDGYRKRETELMIVVTPYLVNPVDDSQIVLPTDGFKNPNDAEKYLLNRLQSGESGGDRPKPTVAEPKGGNPTLGSPAIGSLMPTVPQQPAPQQSAKADKPAKKSKKATKTAAATPGFSF
ncbi:MAG: type II and III secretion system protein family protein [Parasphingorhabdus sp.]|nr:type II and III secretion system protein family protein [Parasphingorhabdus sp.]